MLVFRVSSCSSTSKVPFISRTWLCPLRARSITGAKIIELLISLFIPSMFLFSLWFSYFILFFKKNLARCLTLSGRSVMFIKPAAQLSTRRANAQQLWANKESLTSVRVKGYLTSYLLAWVHAAITAHCVYVVLPIGGCWHPRIGRCPRSQGLICTPTVCS